jgi:hypothetical protein
MKEYPKDLEVVVNNLYNEKFPKVSKAPKTIFKFKVLGRNYDSDIFTHNYKLFFENISKVVPYETISEAVDSCLFSRENSKFKFYEYINGEFYVNTKTTTERKIIHIRNVCDYLGLKMEELHSEDVLV